MSPANLPSLTLPLDHLMGSGQGRFGVTWALLLMRMVRMD
jgi:hypothetical protein